MRRLPPHLLVRLTHSAHERVDLSPARRHRPACFIRAPENTELVMLQIDVDRIAGLERRAGGARAVCGSGRNAIGPAEPGLTEPWQSVEYRADTLHDS